MGNADVGDVGDRRVFEDRGFDLGAVDVLSTADHDVFQTVDDMEETFVVDETQIAGVEPAVGEGLRGRGRSIPVATYDFRATEPQLSGGSRRHVAPGRRIHDSHADDGE